MCVHLAFSKILNRVRLAVRPEANAVTLNQSLTSGSQGLGWYPEARNTEGEDALWSQHPGQGGPLWLGDLCQSHYSLKSQFIHQGNGKDSLINLL